MRNRLIQIILRMRIAFQGRLFAHETFFNNVVIRERWSGYDQPTNIRRLAIPNNIQNSAIYPCPAEPFANSVDPDQLASEEEANWSGSALFAIMYVNLYQQPWSSNLIGWKLGVAS